MRARRQGSCVALLFLDLDRFKDINDSLGHATGDRILRMAAQRLQRAVGPAHTVARIGGDEFTVVLEDLAHAGEADVCAQRVIEAFDEPLLIDDRQEIAITPSIGISLYPDHAQVPTDLLKHADTAMYQAKAMGRHTYQVYSESMDEKNRHRAILASALRLAIMKPRLSIIRLRLGSRASRASSARMSWAVGSLSRSRPELIAPAGLMKSWQSLAAM